MNISNSLSIVWQNLRNESKSNPAFLPLVLLFSTIAMPLGVSNVLLGIYTLVVLITFKKTNLKISISLLLPIALFLWTVLSLFWSIDFKESTSVSRQITLFAIPLLFILQPQLKEIETRKILDYFSGAMFGFAVFYLLKASVRFLLTQEIEVFFYHELVTLKVNAIYVSFFFAMAFLHLYRKEAKTWKVYTALIVLFILIVLLSSKNVLITLLILMLIFHLLYQKRSRKAILYFFTSLVVVLFILANIKQVRDRFLTEFQEKTVQNQSEEVQDLQQNGIRMVTVQEAWEAEKFSPNDFFSGTAFRVYQIRVFKELLQENSIFWQGFGFNASQEKIQEKSNDHNVFQGNETQFGYGSLNFHNQYIQHFAEMGLIGVLILLCFALMNLKNALQSRDFLHFAFAILLISLFLTECFLYRQRGVVFIVLLYCVFNQKKVKNLKILNNK